MQIGNITLSLNAETDNQVQKYGVTPAEVAVLRLIHGDSAVIDIEPTGEVDRTHRAERQRLVETYGRQADGTFKAPHVDALFPGAAARVFETFDELELPEEFYKAATRVSAKPKAPAHPLDHDADGRKGGSKPRAAREDHDFDGMTKAQLVSYARENDIDVDASESKATILEAVKKAQSKPEAREEYTTSGSSPADDEDDEAKDMPDAGVLD